MDALEINAEIAEAENIAWAEASKRFPNIVTLHPDIQKAIYAAFMGGFDSGVAWMQKLMAKAREAERD